MAFLDNFNGEAVTVDLAAHVPSGGSAWTLVDGLAGSAQVSSSSNRLINNTSDGAGALYLCDDQGSANHYVQYRVENVAISAFVCNRATDRNNWIGVRVFNNSLQIWRRSAGTLTQIGAGATSVVVGHVVRLESDGSTHRAYINGALELTVTDSFNGTVTRQGVVARSSGSVGWADDFEAGALSGGATHALEGAAQGTATATGALTTGIPLTGASVSTATATGSITTSISLAGSAASVSVANGALTAQITLSSAALVSALAAGALTTDIRLSGAALSQALAAADLSTESAGLSGSALASSSASGVITTAIPLIGAATATASASGAFGGGPIELAGAAASVSNATGDLTASLALNGDALAQAVAAGSLTAQIQMDGAALSQALASATFYMPAVLSSARRRHSNLMTARRPRNLN